MYHTAKQELRHHQLTVTTSSTTKFYIVIQIILMPLLFGQTFGLYNKSLTKKVNIFSADLSSSLNKNVLVLRILSSFRKIIFSGSSIYLPYFIAYENQNINLVIRTFPLF